MRATEGDGARLREDARRAMIVLVVGCAMFMENLDSTVIQTALPAMAAAFGTSPVDLGLGITAYVAALAMFIPISGWIADRFGGRTTFCAAIAVFTAASALCAAGSSLPGFVAARILQGFGGAMMVPVGRLVLLRNLDKAEFIGAFAMVTVPATFAPLLGAPLGGFITTFLSWRWIFLINLPLGLVGIALALRHIRDGREAGRVPLDLPGFLLTSAAIAAIIFGLELAGRRGVRPESDLALLALGLALAAAAVSHALRAEHPLIDLRLLRIPTFAAGALAGAPYRIAYGALPLVLPLTLQVGLGLSPFACGLMMLASAAGSLGMKRSARPVLRRYGFRTVLIVNGLISGLTILPWIWITPGRPVWSLLLLLLASGFFRSLQFTAFMAITWADIPPEKTSAATSLFGMLQQLSFSGGVAFGTLLLRAGAPGGAALGLPAFRFAFAGIALVTLADALWFLALKRRAGAAVSGHAAPSPPLTG